LAETKGSQQENKPALKVREHTCVEARQRHNKLFLLAAALAGLGALIEGERRGRWRELLLVLLRLLLLFVAAHLAFGHVVLLAAG
jgi:hypothetical protein